MIVKAQTDHTKTKRTRGQVAGRNDDDSSDGLRFVVDADTSHGSDECSLGGDKTDKLPPFEPESRHEANAIPPCNDSSERDHICVQASDDGVIGIQEEERGLARPEDIHRVVEHTSNETDNEERREVPPFLEQFRREDRVFESGVNLPETQDNEACKCYYDRCNNVRTRPGIRDAALNMLASRETELTDR